MSMQPLKHICLICPRFNNQLTEAISKNFVALAQELSSSSQVTTWTPTFYPGLISGDKFFWQEQQSYSAYFKIFLNYRKIGRKLKRDHSKYSVINVHLSIPLDLVLFYLFTTAEIRNKCVITLWQCYLLPKEFSSNYGYFLKHWKEYWHHYLLNTKLAASLSALTYRGYKKIVVQTEYQRRHFEKIGVSGNVVVIPNGVKKTPNNTRDDQFFEKKTKNFLFLGHTTEAKGCDVALKLFAEISKEIQGKLTIASSGFGDDQKIRRLILELGIENKIIWKEKVDVYAELRKAHALIAPYRASVGTSLIPNVLLESFAAGTPVITTGVDMLKGIVQDCENAIIIETDNVQENARKVIEFINQGAACEKLSARQRKIFEDHYRIEKMIAGYRSCFQVCSSLSSA